MKPHYRLHFAYRSAFITAQKFGVWYVSRTYCRDPNITLRTADYMFPCMAVFAVTRGALA